MDKAIKMHLTSCTKSLDTLKNYISLCNKNHFYRYKLLKIFNKHYMNTPDY